MEADQRHAELIVEQLQLQVEKGVCTPGMDDQDEHNGDALESLGSLEANSFRGVAARCIYLSADCPDFMFQV